MHLDAGGASAPAALDLEVFQGRRALFLPQAKWAQLWSNSASDVCGSNFVFVCQLCGWQACLSVMRSSPNSSCGNSQSRDISTRPSILHMSVGTVSASIVTHRIHLPQDTFRDRKT